jgi:hypothetical protein
MAQYGGEGILLLWQVLESDVAPGARLRRRGRGLGGKAMLVGELLRPQSVVSGVEREQWRHRRLAGDPLHHQRQRIGSAITNADGGDQPGGSGFP